LEQLLSVTDRTLCRFACPALECQIQSFVLEDTLDSYEATLDAWLVEPGNLVLYGKLSSQIEAVRMMSSSALPSATGALGDLLLAAC
jgi:hypothetical protein